MEKYTIDELLDVLQWARDRAAYFRACNKPMPGALYAEDCKAERDTEAELYRRGYYTTWNAIASPTRRKQKRQVNIAGRAEKPVVGRWAAENMKRSKIMRYYGEYIDANGKFQNMFFDNWQDWLEVTFDPCCAILVVRDTMLK